MESGPFFWVKGIPFLFAFISLYALPIISSTQATNSSDLVMKPNSAVGEPICLLFVQGMAYPANSYRALGEQLQTTLANHSFSLWIGVPSYDEDTVSLDTIDAGLVRVRAALMRIGMPSSAALFVAAHGPHSGGVLQAYASNQGIESSSLSDLPEHDNKNGGEEHRKKEAKGEHAFSPEEQTTRPSRPLYPLMNISNGIILFGSTLLPQFQPNSSNSDTALKSMSNEEDRQAGQPKLHKNAGISASTPASPTTFSLPQNESKQSLHDGPSFHMHNALTTPILSIVGTLDGVCPITQTAVAFFKQILHPPRSQPNATLNTPVVAVDGMSHTQISTVSPVPPYVQALDLQSQMSDEDARFAVADILATFVSLQFHTLGMSKDITSGPAIAASLDTSRNSYDWDHMLDLQRSTQKLLDPLIHGLLLEGSYLLYPPCYKSQSPSSPCQNGSTWLSSRAQNIMAGLENYSWVQMRNTDLFWPVDEVFPHDYLPFIHNSCPPSPQPCTLFSRTVTELWYEPQTVDTSFSSLSLTSSFSPPPSPLQTLWNHQRSQSLHPRQKSSTTPGSPAPVPSSAAYEMMSKLNSRQCVWAHAGLNSSDFNTTDEGPRCAEINEAVFIWAMGTASPIALSRFNQTGVPLIFGQDLDILVYPLWSGHRLEYTKLTKDGRTIVEVCAPTMRFQDTLPFVGCLHFCKLLSPARALQWIYVDGLRRF